MSTLRRQQSHVLVVHAVVVKFQRHLLRGWLWYYISLGVLALCLSRFELRSAVIAI